MLTNNAAYNFETQYNGPFLITRCCNNGKVTVKCGAVQIRHNIRRIKPYTSDTNVEDINPKNMCDDVNI